MADMELDDLDRAGKRDERNMRVLEHGNHRQRRARGRAADHGENVVLLDQARREGARIVGVTPVIVDDELELFAVHSALGIDVIDIDFERPLPNFAEFL